jgi:hypothetical protein
MGISPDDRRLLSQNGTMDGIGEEWIQDPEATMVLGDDTRIDQHLALPR